MAKMTFVSNTARVTVIVRPREDDARTNESQRTQDISRSEADRQTEGYHGQTAAGATTEQTMHD